MKPAKKKPITAAVPRLGDKRLLAVLTAFDRACGSPAHHSDGDTEDAGIVICCLDRMLGTEQSDWLCDGWPISSMRRLLLAYCDLAPDDKLTEMAAAAKGFVRWLVDFEDDPDGNIRGYSVVTGEKRPRETRAA